MDDFEFERCLDAYSLILRRLNTPTRRVKELKRRIVIKRGTKYNNPPITYTVARNPIMDAAFPPRKVGEVPFKGRTDSRLKVMDFNLFENPEGVMKFLQDYSRRGSAGKLYSVDFLDRIVTDIAPFLMFALAKRGTIGAMVNGGYISSQACAVINKMGISDLLNISVPENETHSIHPLTLHQRRAPSSSTSKGVSIAAQASTIEQVAEKIVDEISRWLSCALTVDALSKAQRGWLNSIMGEALNNSERHGSADGDSDWLVTGFMQVHKSDVKETPICNITILNIGVPISETISGATGAVKNGLDKYCQMHQGRKRSPNLLATVFALQDGVSRFPDGYQGSTGGTGLLNLVKMVASLCSEKKEHLSQPAQMVILSGDTYLIFDDIDKSMWKDDEDSLEPRRWWFNRENSSRTPPSDEHVRSMPFSFPGTVITARFALGE